jgi:hypothetical protein
VVLVLRAVTHIEQIKAGKGCDD